MCKGIETGRFMPHNNECRTRNGTTMEHNEDGREGLKKEQQRQDRQLEKAVARSVQEDPALREAEEEHKRELVETENKDGPRQGEAETEVKRQDKDEQPDQKMDHPSDDVRGAKSTAEDEGEHAEAKREDGMIVSFLREEEVTRRDIHEALTTRGRHCLESVEESDDKDADVAMDVPMGDYELSSWQKRGTTLTVKNLTQKGWRKHVHWRWNNARR